MMSLPRFQYLMVKFLCTRQDKAERLGVQGLSVFGYLRSMSSEPNRSKCCLECGKPSGDVVCGMTLLLKTLCFIQQLAQDLVGFTLLSAASSLHSLDRILKAKLGYSLGQAWPAVLIKMSAMIPASSLLPPPDMWKARKTWRTFGYLLSKHFQFPPRPSNFYSLTLKLGLREAFTHSQ